MSEEQTTIDPERLKEFIERVYTLLGGAVLSAMIYLGDKLRLYEALRQAGAVSSDELARKTGLHERWLREWLQGQASAGLLRYEGAGRFALGPEAELVLADESSPAFAAGGFSSLPQQFAVLEGLPEAFRTGIGHPYDAFGPEGAVGIERFLAPWFRTFLVPLALPSLEGVVAKLQGAAKVADVGCGAGLALLEMAKAYPQSDFHGYEISKHALARAAANKDQAGVSNLTFHDASGDTLPADGSFDFVTTFDCIHDMTQPEATIRAIRRALKPDGTWLLADINAKPTFEQNMAENPMAAMMYGFSILSCLASSLSEPGGAGLGTLGLSESVARDLAAAAGFTRFVRHDFQNPVNAYYEIRP